MMRGEPTRDEWQITSYLDELGVPYVHKMKLGELDPEAKIPKGEFDIFLPDYLMAIETSPGWHEGGPHAKNFPDVVANDQYKKEFAKEHGIDLVSFDPAHGTEKFINEVLVPKLRSVGVKAFEVHEGDKKEEEEGRWDDAEKELDKEYQRNQSPRRPTSHIPDTPFDTDAEGWEDVPINVPKGVEQFGPISISDVPSADKKPAHFWAVCQEDGEQQTDVDYDIVADWVLEHLSKRHPDFKYSPSMHPGISPQGEFTGLSTEDIKGLREEDRDFEKGNPFNQQYIYREEAGYDFDYNIKYREKPMLEEQSGIPQNIPTGAYDRVEPLEIDQSQNYPLHPSRGKVNQIDQGGKEEPLEATNNLFMEEVQPMESWIWNYIKDVGDGFVECKIKGCDMMWHNPSQEKILQHFADVHPEPDEVPIPRSNWQKVGDIIGEVALDEEEEEAPSEGRQRAKEAAYALADQVVEDIERILQEGTVSPMEGDKMKELETKYKEALMDDRVTEGTGYLMQLVDLLQQLLAREESKGAQVSV